MSRYSIMAGRLERARLEDERDRGREAHIERRQAAGDLGKGGAESERAGELVDDGPGHKLVAPDARGRRCPRR